MSNFHTKEKDYLFLVYYAPCEFNVCETRAEARQVYNERKAQGYTDIQIEGVKRTVIESEIDEDEEHLRQLKEQGLNGYDKIESEVQQ